MNYVWPIAFMLACVIAGMVAGYKIERDSDIEMARAGLQQCQEGALVVRFVWKKECK